MKKRNIKKMSFSFRKISSIAKLIATKKVTVIVIASITIFSTLLTSIILYANNSNIAIDSHPVTNKLCDSNESIEGLCSPEQNITSNKSYESSFLDSSIANENCFEPYELPDKEITMPYKENPFISTKEEPLSTFSSDVDTASYIQFRQNVNNGYGYIQENIPYRTEEFINFFSYDYKEPTSGQMFGVTTEVGVCPWNTSNALVRIGIKASDIQKNDDKPLNLVFLIDSSGSMSSSDKLPLLQKSLKALLPKLDKGDTISLVTYSGESRVVLSGASGKQSWKIAKALNSIEASGGTNGGAGLEMAYKTAKKYYSKEKNNRIMLCTDGDLNVGLTSVDEIKSYIEEQRKTGIYLSVLGFGYNNYNDSILETIADNGNGSYTVIDNIEQGKKVLLDQFNGTINTIATDVKFQVNFDDSKIDTYRLIGYENRLLNNEDFDDDTKDAGEVGSGQTLTIMYEIIPRESLTKDAIELNIRYKNNFNNKSKLENTMIDCTPSNKLSSDFIFASSVAYTSLILNNSQYIEKKDLGYVRMRLSTLNLKDPDKKEFLALIKKLTDNIQ